MNQPSEDLRLPRSFGAALPALLKGSSHRRIAKYSMLLDQFEKFERELQSESDRDLRKRSLSLRFRAKSGERLSHLMPEAYALVREAARRTVKMRHFDVQMIGGVALFHGAVAEMETGEGKTLTATLPMYLQSLSGKGSHLATVNDYLAQRDADTMRPIYELLGLTLGVIQTKDQSDDRREAYGCDITYGTAKEFGFDFMRDRLLMRRLGMQKTDFLGGGGSHRWDSAGEQPVQRGSHFCLVDEADSILIDEARTPLIIGSLGEKTKEQVIASFQWAAKTADRFEEDEHYEYDHDKKKVELTILGRQLVRAMSKPDAMSSVGLIDQYEYAERGIKVDRDFQLDRQYIVLDEEIVIVDEFTGRLAEGRKWRDGIHQAIEAKEEVEVSVPTGQAARITVQDLFLRYRHLAGMTGTAISSAKEIHKIYKIHVIKIPTNRPVRRTFLPNLVFGSGEEKWTAIVSEIVDVHRQGRPVLIGTRSIDKSELLSRMLSVAGIEHEVLNANEIAQEAEIVAKAGERGKVTVATNMAGRGTDIKLGEGIAELGGLHVICTEMHDSARIDRQLAGRCGRQGDPGSTQQFLAMDDEILGLGFGPDKGKKFESAGQGKDQMPQSYSKFFRKAQRRVEKRHFRDRAALLHHEKQRKKMQREMGLDPYLDTAD